MGKLLKQTKNNTLKKIEEYRTIAAYYLQSPVFNEKKYWAFKETKQIYRLKKKTIKTGSKWAHMLDFI